MVSKKKNIELKSQRANYQQYKSLLKFRRLRMEKARERESIESA